MTPAQQQRELARQQREIDAAYKRAAREAERQQRAAAKQAEADARARQKTLDTAIRTGGKVVTSRLGQDIIRGVFGTLFGGGRKG
jgi:septal ring factor EnvC (AmiA/AmiB activator)